MKHNFIQSAEKDFKIENYIDYRQPFTMFFGIDNYLDLSSVDLIKYNQYKLALNKKARSNTRMYIVEKQMQTFVQDKDDEVSASSFWKQYFTLTSNKSLT